MDKDNYPIDAENNPDSSINQNMDVGDGYTARQQLKASGVGDEVMRQILVASGHAYVIWVRNDTNPYVTSSLSELLGYPLDHFELSGIDRIRELVHPDDMPALIDALGKVMQEGGSYECECRLQCADGQYLWVRVKGSSYNSDDKGRATRFWGCITDIHELKTLQLKTEQDRARSKWMSQTCTELFEANDLAVLERALGSLARNLGCCRAFLRLKNPLTGSYEMVSEWHVPDLLPMSEALTPEIEAMMQTNLAQMLKEGMVLRTPDDDLTVNQAKIRCLLGIKHAVISPMTYLGKVRGAISFMARETPHWEPENLELANEFANYAFLIFERYAIAKKLRESEERFQLAMEASEDGIWDVTQDGGDVYVSPSYFRMVGLDAPGGTFDKKVTGQNVHPDDLVMVRHSIAGFWEEPETSRSFEFRMLHKNGSTVWVLTRMRKVEFDANARATRIIGVNTDITSYKKIQSSLLNAQMEATSANRAKSEFLARMSHEIRTPMNAILGMSHLLLDNGLTTEQKGKVKHIDDAAHLLLHIIDDILDFSKIEAGKMDLEETPVNLLEVVGRLNNLMAYRAEEKGISFVIDLHPSVPTVILCDLTRLQQILVNLLNNAIKFTHQGGVFCTIALAPDGQSLQFIVRDTGIGIDENGKRQLFKPFSQADGSVTRRYGGTGLGLTICKSLAELMGGEVHCESEPGQGSEFTLRLPLKAAAKQPAFSSHGCDIVIWHDCLASARALERLCVRLGCRVVHATDVEDVLAHAQRIMAPETGLLCFVAERVVDDQARAALQSLARQRADVMIITLVGLKSINGGMARNTGNFKHLAHPVTPEKLQSLLKPLEPGLHHSSATDVDAKRELAGRRVLLVEDNLVNQKVAVGMLKKKSVEVEVAMDGLQAVELLEARGPEYFDVVLMDMEMPRLDGYEASRRIRKNNKFADLPIIAMTAHAMKGDRELCLQAGMNDYIAKPINPNVLYEVLQKFMD